MFDRVSLEEVTEVMATAARAEMAFVSNSEKLAVVEGLERLRRFVDATETVLLADLDAHDVTDVEFGMGTGRWLAHHCQLPSAVANSRVQTAVKLANTLPETREALFEGRIGFDHARQMCRAANPRIIDQIREMEADLLAPIPHASFERWKQELTGICEQLDQDGGFDPNDDPTHQRAAFTRGPDGLLYFDGRLVGTDAASVEEAVTRRTDELYRQHVRDHRLCPELEIPSLSALRAIALAELVRLGWSAHRGGTAVEPATDITVVMPVDDPYGVATTLLGARLSDRLVDLLKCNAEFSRLVIDDLGVPLDLGRSHRYANRDQRRAIHVRDGCCVFPGCSVPVHRCDIHHVRYWEQGGPTDLFNLAPPLQTPPQGVAPPRMGHARPRHPLHLDHPHRPNPRQPSTTPPRRRLTPGHLRATHHPTSSSRTTATGPERHPDSGPHRRAPGTSAAGPGGQLSRRADWRPSPSDRSPSR